LTAKAEAAWRWLGPPNDLLLLLLLVVRALLVRPLPPAPGAVLIRT
jgi:hypothetical protein